MFTTYMAYISSSLVDFVGCFSDTSHPDELISTLAHLK